LPPRPGERLGERPGERPGEYCLPGDFLGDLPGDVGDILGDLPLFCIERWLIIYPGSWYVFLLPKKYAQMPHPKSRKARIRIEKKTAYSVS